MAKILLLCGSLRSASINSILLDAAKATAPADMECVYSDSFANLPLYNQDQDTAQPPAPVERFRRDVVSADGLIIATPEYNHSIPGVLKNAIDWASRPYGNASLCGKSVVVLVATMGVSAGHHGSAHLRSVLTDMENFVVPSPCLIVQLGGQKLRRDADGRAIYDDPMGQRILAANWAALAYAMRQGAGKICQAGSAAMAAGAKA